MINNNIFQRFRSLHFPKDAIGLEWSGNDVTYFCTPMGAEIIGCLGVDGILFCFIPSISLDMVFAVSPMPCGEHYVEPIANNFQEFLSLVISCKGASPLEQICYISEEQFLELLKSEKEYSWTERNDALYTLCEKLLIKPHSNVYQHVKCLQENFDYSIIPFSEEYYEIVDVER